MSDTVSLWRPTGPEELRLVADSKWRAWPPRLPEQPIFYPVLNRWYATKIAREWNVPAKGIGYVTRFDVRKEFLDRYEVHQVGGQDVLEYWIPAEALDDLNANIVGAIREVAEYRAAVDEPEMAGVEKALGFRFPDSWRSWLQGPSWLHRGWMSATHCFVWLYRPTETLEAHRAWMPATELHPRIAVIGSDGASEMLALDLRTQVPRVMLVNASSAGWEDAIPQPCTLEELVGRLEDGSFEFVFE